MDKLEIHSEKLEKISERLQALEITAAVMPYKLKAGMLGMLGGTLGAILYNVMKGL